MSRFSFYPNCNLNIKVKFEWSHLVRNFAKHNGSPIMLNGSTKAVTQRSAIARFTTKMLLSLRRCYNNNNILNIINTNSNNNNNNNNNNRRAGPGCQSGYRSGDL